MGNTGCWILDAAFYAVLRRAKGYWILDAGVAPVALVEERPRRDIGAPRESIQPPSLKLRRAKPSTHSYAAPRGLEECPKMDLRSLDVSATRKTAIN